MTERELKIRDRLITKLLEKMIPYQIQLMFSSERDSLARADGIKQGLWESIYLIRDIFEKETRET